MSSFDNEDPLEALYNQIQLNRKVRVVRPKADPAVGTTPDHSIYTNPDNWERTRGVALIDRDSQALVGNFSEYVHKRFPSTRKLLREHAPISIEATELVSGYLGAEMEMRLRDQDWTTEHFATADIQLDEMVVEAPAVRLSIKTRLGAIIRVDLLDETQFASLSGNTLLILPAETDILSHCSTDTKIRVKREAGL